MVDIVPNPTSHIPGTRGQLNHTKCSAVSCRWAPRAGTEKALGVQDSLLWKQGWMEEKVLQCRPEKASAMLVENAGASAAWIASQGEAGLCIPGDAN